MGASLSSGSLQPRLTEEHVSLETCIRSLPLTQELQAFPLGREESRWEGLPLQTCDLLAKMCCGLDSDFYLQTRH